MRNSFTHIFPAVAITLAAASPCVHGQIIRGDITIRLDTVATGLTAPVTAIHANDGSDRLFIADQSGVIYLLKNGQLALSPFLDITHLIVNLNPGFDERGLLGLAFHPNFAVNGRFFVRYSAPRPEGPLAPCTGTSRGCHREIVAEFQVSDTDPDVADPTPRIVFAIDEPQFNHNSGAIHFGPDGFLYFTLGDGGGANDGLNDPELPHGAIGNGQNIETALGSMLRIDVNSGNPYAIPPDNPFVGTNGVNEIFAYGFRNPFTFTFDDGPGGDGRLFVGDVGQDLIEEIDIVVNGGNYGWALREGANCFDPFNPKSPPPSCDSNGLIDPIAEYTQADGGLSVIIGHVYRGSNNPSLSGLLLFGDFSRTFVPADGSLYFLDEPAPNQHVINEFRLAPFDHRLGLYLKGFGEDANGEVYVLTSQALAPFGTTGAVHRMTVVGDSDGNRIMDEADIATMVDCVGGPGVGAGLACDSSDFDGDGDVDLMDAAGFQIAFTPAGAR